jgi:hypothetical protein
MEVSDPIDIQKIKSEWNKVLDLLLVENRIAWLAYFDARLVSFESNTLTLDFSDSEKFSAPHDFKKARNENQKLALQTAIKKIFGITPDIIER